MIFEPYQWFFSDFLILISCRITCREIGKVVFFRQECDKNILSVIFNPYQWFISDFNLISLDFALFSSLVTCRENEKKCIFCGEYDENILSVTSGQTGLVAKLEIASFSLFNSEGPCKFSEF